VVIDIPPNISQVPSQITRRETIPLAELGPWQTRGSQRNTAT